MKSSGMTGEKVDIAGVYQNKYGKRVSLDTNTVFPPCPEKGSSTKWEKID